MLRAGSHSLGALEAAAALDVDRTAEDRAFFTAERATLPISFNEVFAADQCLIQPLLLTTQRLQTRVLLGDAVLEGW